jgi:hypothetical protein
MNVQEISGFEDWDNFVRHTASGTIFHTSSWLQASPHKFAKIGVLEHGRLLAGAVVQIDDDGLGTLGTLAPYLGPILIKDNDFRAEKKRKIMSLLIYGIQNLVPQATFFVSPWFEDLQQFICKGFQAKLLYTSVIKTIDLEKTKAKFSSTLKRNLKAGVEVGLRVELSSDPTELISLVQQSFTRQGHSTWFSLDEVNSCMCHLLQMRKAACFITRDRDNYPIAGAGIVWDWHRSYYILGGYDNSRSHRGGSSLAIWKAIQFTHQELHLDEIDLEGSYLPAIERFFRQFGGQWLPYYFLKDGSHTLFDTDEV